MTNLTVVPIENLLLASFEAEGCEAGLGVARSKDKGYGFFVEFTPTELGDYAEAAFKYVGQIDELPSNLDVPHVPKFVKKILPSQAAQFCSRGLMIKIDDDEFVLVAMTSEQLKNHALVASKFYNKLTS